MAEDVAAPHSERFVHSFPARTSHRDAGDDSRFETEVGPLVDRQAGVSNEESEQPSTKTLSWWTRLSQWIGLGPKQDKDAAQSDQRRDGSALTRSARPHHNAHAGAERRGNAVAVGHELQAEQGHEYGDPDVQAVRGSMSAQVSYGAENGEGTGMLGEPDMGNAAAEIRASRGQEDGDRRALENESKRDKHHNAWDAEYRDEELPPHSGAESSEGSSHAPSLSRTRSAASTSSSAVADDDELSGHETRLMVRTFFRLFRALDKHLSGTLGSPHQMPELNHNNVKPLNGKDEEGFTADDNAAARLSAAHDDTDDQQASERKDGEFTGREEQKPHASKGGYFSNLLRKRTEKAHSAEQEKGQAAKLETTVRVDASGSGDEGEEELLLNQRGGAPPWAPSFSASKRLLADVTPSPKSWSHIVNRVGSFILGTSDKPQLKGR
jgi:hypothetical protein